MCTCHSALPHVVCEVSRGVLVGPSHALLPGALLPRELRVERSHGDGGSLPHVEVVAHAPHVPPHLYEAVLLAGVEFVLLPDLVLLAVGDASALHDLVDVVHGHRQCLDDWLSHQQTRREWHQRRICQK